MVKTADDLALMRVSGRLLAQVFEMLDGVALSGLSTLAINDLVERYITHDLSARPASKGQYGFAYVLNSSINQVVCHGVPSAEDVVKDGDIVNLDITVIKDGYHGDTSRMFYVGPPSIQARRLVDLTYDCMWRGIRAIKPGNTLGDIGHAIQSHAERNGCSIVREFCGHGIGRKFHEDPQILHYGSPGMGLRLEAGMIFTVEPMINAGRPDIRQMADGWTIVTKDHSLSAQWEHTVLVTADGHEVLTLSAGSPPPA